MEITNSNVREYTVTGSWSVNGSMKHDKDSVESKSFTLDVRFDNVPIIDVINKALDPTKIQWVNGPGRVGFAKLADKSVVKIDFKSPGRTVVDPIEEIKARAAGMDKAARIEYLKGILALVE